ncbi:MAG: exodeoxyribonuclease VII small subunit [Clostridia bacterium]
MSIENKELNFEETMQELEKIVQELEKGELNLDDSINKFEEGMKLSKNASKYLEEAEKKITVLINSKDGEITEEEF